MWKLAALAGRRGRKGEVLLALWEGKGTHEHGGWTYALGEMRLSVLNQWNCKILVVYPLKVKCENTPRGSWDLS